MNIKAIETVYKKHRFRSRLEAKWAYFFDLLEIRWEYEKEGFELPSGKYLPDFWLPDQRMWSEVKAGDFTKKESRLVQELAEQSGFSVFELIGLPENMPYAAAHPEGGYFEYLLTNHHNYPSGEYRFYACPADYERFMDTEVACDAVKAIRFEHGESPKLFEIPRNYRSETIAVMA